MPERRGKLLLVREKEADGRIREIFELIKQSLGIPFVPVIYQALAAYPEFLEQHWRAFSQLTAAHQFFQLGDRLRGEAYTRMHNYFQISDLFEPLTEMSFSRQGIIPSNPLKRSLGGASAIRARRRKGARHGDARARLLLR